MAHKAQEGIAQTAWLTHVWRERKNSIAFCVEPTKLDWRKRPHLTLKQWVSAVACMIHRASPRGH